MGRRILLPFYKRFLLFALCIMQKGYCLASKFNLRTVSSSGGVSNRLSLGVLAWGWRTILVFGRAVREELTALMVAESVFGFI
jgi:hypothetical protein